jgi:hypothetical protein
MNTEFAMVLRVHGERRGRSAKLSRAAKTPRFPGDPGARAAGFGQGLAARLDAAEIAHPAQSFAGANSGKGRTGCARPALRHPLVAAVVVTLKTDMRRFLPDLTPPVRSCSPGRRRAVSGVIDG